MTPAAPPDRRGGPLAGRAVHFAIVLAVFGCLAWADAVGFLAARPAWWLLPVAAALAVAGADEVARLVAARGAAVPAWLLRPATAAVVIAAAAGGDAFAAVSTPPATTAALCWAAAAVALGMMAIFVTEIAGYSSRAGGDRGAALDRVAAGVLALVLVGLPLAFMVALRLLGGRGDGVGERAGGDPGIVPLLSLVAAAKGGDVAAFVVGSLFGRRRMAPALSPGKTWEGAMASLAGAVLASWLVLARLGAGSGRGPAGGWLGYGLAIGVAAICGDLAESLIKRECGAKDSGRTLGGLGGVLDLVDSFIFAAPVAWLLWVMG